MLLSTIYNFILHYHCHSLFSELIYNILGQDRINFIFLDSGFSNNIIDTLLQYYLIIILYPCIYVCIKTQTPIPYLPVGELENIVLCLLSYCLLFCLFICALHVLITTWTVVCSISSSEFLNLVTSIIEFFCNMFQTRNFCVYDNDLFGNIFSFHLECSSFVASNGCLHQNGTTTNCKTCY